MLSLKPHAFANRSDPYIILMKELDRLQLQPRRDPVQMDYNSSKCVHCFRKFLNYLSQPCNSVKKGKRKMCESEVHEKEAKGGKGMRTKEKEGSWAETVPH